MRLASWGVVCGLALGGAHAVMAADQVVWPYDVLTSGDDVFESWPDAVDPNAHAYDLTNEVQQIIVNASFSIFTLDVDVTDQVPPEALLLTTIVPGPAPLLSDPVDFVYPAPPEDPGVAATLDVAVDAAGIGSLAVTNVVLGDVQVDFPPFGTVTATVNSIRAIGSVTATSVQVGDVNRDCTVGFDDIIALLAAWGACSDGLETCPADMNFDGMVGFDDLVRLLANWSTDK